MLFSRKIPWVVKYRPKKIDEIVNQEKAKKLFIEWIDTWVSKKPEKKSALLYGPPGSGKNSLVEAVARERGFELLEMNASDYRRASDIERIAKTSSRVRSLTNTRGKIVLLDEVDGISDAADLGALEAILKLVENTQYPVVLIANNPWSPKLWELRNRCLMIEFRRLTKTDVKKVLRSICASEKLVCDDDAVDYIAERSEGDLRSAINDLEAVGEGFGRVTLSAARALLRARDRDLETFNVVRKILVSRYAWQAKEASTQTDLAPNELIGWIHENLPKQAQDPEDLWRAYEALSRADVYFSRIFKSGNWDLLAYAVDMMTAGVALSIKNEQHKFKWVSYSPPETRRLAAEAKEANRVREDLAKIVATHLKCSTSTVKSDVIPLLKVIFDNNPEYAAKLALGLNLSDSMIIYLSENMGSQIVKHIEKLRQEIRQEARKTMFEQKKSRVSSSTAIAKQSEKKEEKNSKGLENFLKK
ncbi:MAG: replication factor C large subunit [Sulfolobales archaeon]|nr:replication factor C large subunit [Sulfolobales archaeon]MDW8082367.1 replication factor C large subunit [Sulfolobales archaeon]